MKTWILIFSLLFVAPCFAGGYTFESLAVQDGGRVKPLLTVAQESLQLIYGRSKYKGQSAIRIFSTWMMVPEVWYEKPIIRLDHLGLKKSLGFAEDQKFFTPKELVEHPRLNVLFADLSGRVAKKEKLDPYYQAVQRLEGQVLTYIGIRQGALKIFPSQDPERQGHWLAVAELPEADRDLFFKMLSDFASTFTSESKEARQQAAMDLQNSVDRFVEKASAGGQYPQATKMLREVHYQTLHPFLWTWIFYLMAAIFVGLSYLFLQKLFYFVGWASALFGFLMHTYGFILRVQITGRPPVANMYETVVWVGWGVALFAGIFTLVRKKKFILLSGSIVATFAMVMADMAPVILDPSLQPLEPVLRSNMWLVIHVMTITLSYAAFFLAFGIGDYGVLLSIKDETANKAKIRELSKTCYQLIQVGVLLLAAGTILGGVWADYSWGRFWGWDPKETWAFIALMGYLALLHARLVGWVKDFGILAGSVVSFSLVIMAWYGVNFVLGAGLHSYGFGAGGVEYVSAFVGLHIIYVVYAIFIKSRVI